MSKQVILTDRLMRPIAHFSHAVRVGNLVHVGATAGTDAQRRLAGAEAGLTDVAAQTRRMFDNVGVVCVCSAPGSRIRSASRPTSPISATRAAYREIQTRGSQRSGRSCGGGLHGFPLPQAAIELDLVAMVDDADSRSPSGDVVAGERFYGSSRRAADGRSCRTASAAALTEVAARAERSGFARKEIVYLHVTLADVRDAGGFAEAFAAAFPTEPPACTVVVAPLPDRGLALQVEAIAARGGGRRIATPMHPAAHPSAPRRCWLATSSYRRTVRRGCGGRSGRGSGGADSRGLGARPGGSSRRRGEDGSILRTNNLLTDWRDYAGFQCRLRGQRRGTVPAEGDGAGGAGAPWAVVQVEAIAHRRGDEAVIVQVPA